MWLKDVAGGLQQQWGGIFSRYRRAMTERISRKGTSMVYYNLAV